MFEPAQDGRLDLLVVCTANQARSPVGVMLFEHEAIARLGADHGWAMASAGVYAEPGHPLLPVMAAALEQRALGMPMSRSRPVTVDELERTRLVLTMTEEHRRAVNRMTPSLVGRSYTVCEIDRLTSSELWDAAWDGGPDVVERLRKLRPLVPGASQPEDIADPAGHSVGVSVAILDELSARIARISQHLFGPTPDASA